MTKVRLPFTMRERQKFIAISEWMGEHNVAVPARMISSVRFDRGVIYGEGGDYTEFDFEDDFLATAFLHTFS